MCNTSYKITFCSCTTNEFAATDFVWKLHHFLMHKPTMLMGKVFYPPALEDSLVNYPNVLKLLNETPDLFDFEYTPKENDEITIRREIPRGALNFIYQNGSWKIGSNNHFSAVTKEIAQGKLKVE